MRERKPARLFVNPKPRRICWLYGILQILICRTVVNSLLQRRRGTTKWWMRRSPLGCISRELCGFCLVTQGFLCNETRLTKDVKPLKERPPHPPLPRSPCLATARSRSGSNTPPACYSLPSRRFATRWGRLKRPLNQNLIIN